MSLKDHVINEVYKEQKGLSSSMRPKKTCWTQWKDADDSGMDRVEVPSDEHPARKSTWRRLGGKVQGGHVHT